tara:strand:+ start:922 stop:1584 length:663 start_codon:yes stop_codon:yes gene_type:complete
MTPLLYSFRRCPYAMRARLALLYAAGPQVALREVVLRNKPDAFLRASPSGTVPCLVLPDSVIDESLDIMVWAFGSSDPLGLSTMPPQGWAWIERCDGPFKDDLDRTKYSSRYPDLDATVSRDRAAEFLQDLNDQIGTFILDRPSLADLAIAPFVRQFAFIDKPWFDAQSWPQLQHWLNRFLTSDGFASIMEKYPPWADAGQSQPFPPSGLVDHHAAPALW